MRVSLLSVLIIPGLHTLVPEATVHNHSFVFYKTKMLCTLSQFCDRIMILGKTYIDPLTALVECIAFLFRICKVSDSNLALDTGHSNIVPVFLRISMTLMGEHIKVGLPHSVYSSFILLFDLIVDRTNQLFWYFVALHRDANNFLCVSLIVTIVSNRSCILIRCTF